MIFLSELMVVIPQLPCLFRMVNAVWFQINLVNSANYDTVHSCNFAMWAFANKCFPNELVPCADGWWRTWWWSIHMIPGLPVSSIPQWENNCHKDTCLELFQAIEHCEPTFIKAHQPSMRICKARSLKPRIKTRSFLEQIIPSSNEVFKGFESNKEVVTRKLDNMPRGKGKSNFIVQQNVGF